MTNPTKRSAATVAMVFGALLLGAGCVEPDAGEGELDAEEELALGEADQELLGCGVQIGNTYRTGDTIYGFGSLDHGCASAGTIYLQRHLGGDSWDTLRAFTVLGPGYDQSISFDCRYWGTQTYRTRIVRGSNAKNSNRLTTTCSRF